MEFDGCLWYIHGISTIEWCHFWDKHTHYFVHFICLIAERWLAANHLIDQDALVAKWEVTDS